ncbi:hypothetical protein G6F29_007492 [Rhizopus arrhizus]|uniref:Uncharacterized protein n=3 Tax=Rhizopus TaxID=4842 RepID=I1BNZ1_RHIO9|nr:hypothetical protein RO3G_02625 [Rhizopus delemar RA 99-880]KAG0742991.1 hypothetical protein G6F23_006380 [Rhizopus arrhizus]KAG1053425.1 hypothetical protein G6F43_004494 [Rhizopus delemar]KAG0764570.1 hypothetical protein G6F24_005112 [Rhizopus arrhizus]KAG0811942.1 hypothetical protein G6F20_006755 [Rhizopus arrhizus]|eukprot:EIE77921.1 hypothetical protein RO3G_02625 [Rhizopus delemar RA 99-880]
MEHCIVNNNTYSLKRKSRGEDDHEESLHTTKRFHKERYNILTNDNNDTHTITKEQEDVMMYDPFTTDEDESLDTSLFNDYIEEDEKDYTEALERGWSDLFNDNSCWHEN